MQRPRLIATGPVCARALELIATDPQARREYDGLMVRVETIFDMTLLSYGEEPVTPPITLMSPIVLPADVPTEFALPISEPEASPLDFLPQRRQLRAGAAAGRSAPRRRHDTPGTGVRAEGLFGERDRQGGPQPPAGTGVGLAAHAGPEICETRHRRDDAPCAPCRTGASSFWPPRRSCRRSRSAMTGSTIR